MTTATHTPTVNLDTLSAAIAVLQEAQNTYHDLWVHAPNVRIAKYYHGKFDGYVNAIEVLYEVAKTAR